MFDFQHESKCMDILIQHCKDFKQYHSLLNSLKTVENKLEDHGLVDPYEAYMNIERYYHISQLILNKPNVIVIDCGCGIGFQQLLFQDCKRYIGIDLQNNAFVLTDNALFCMGSVDKVIPQLREENKLEGEVYCISVMAGMCFEDIRNTMYQFNKVINI